MAHLKHFRPDVGVRKQQELAWKGARTGLALHRFDALQTHDLANAQVLFKSGSELDIQQNTYIVIDHDPKAGTAPGQLSGQPKEDRVVLREGSLNGSTRKELWLLTSSAMLRLKAPRDGGTAQAHIAVEQGRKLEVELRSGEGMLVNTQRMVAKGQPERIAIGKNVLVTLEAPVTPSAQLQHEWEAVAPATLIKTPPPEVELKLEEPKDGVELTTHTVHVSGKLSGSGARILVDGQDTPIDHDLRFSMMQSLDPGANVVVVQLIRPSGKVQFQRRTVVRK